MGKALPFSYCPHLNFLSQLCTFFPQYLNPLFPATGIFQPLITMTLVVLYFALFLLGTPAFLYAAPSSAAESGPACAQENFFGVEIVTVLLNPFNQLSALAFCKDHAWPPPALPSITTQVIDSLHLFHALYSAFSALYPLDLPSLSAQFNYP